MKLKWLTLSLIQSIILFPPQTGQCNQCDGTLSLICIKNGVCPDSLLVGNSWQTCDLCSTSLTPPPPFLLYTFPCCASCDQQCEVSSLGAGPALLIVAVLPKVSLRVLKPGLKVIGCRGGHESGSAEMTSHCNHMSFTSHLTATQWQAACLSVWLVARCQLSCHFQTTPVHSPLENKLNWSGFALKH